MKKLLYFAINLISLLFFTSSCSPVSDTVEKEKAFKLSGLYVNSTVIENSDNKLIGYTPNYCLELNFLSQDSVMVYNGFEEYKLLIVNEKDNLFNLKEASHKGDMFLKVTSDSTFLLIDSAWTEIKTPSLFKKSKNDFRFENYMNIKNIAGKYILKNLIDSSIQNIEFKFDGKIASFNEFNSYQLCFAGDCMSEPLDEINTILLIGNDTSNTYAMDKNHETQVITLYNLEPSKVDIKGERAILNKIYELTSRNN